MSVIGASVARSDAAAKVTGSTRYTVDVQFAGMLHGLLLRSPLPSARIKSIDTAAAVAMPGVRAVITADDVPDARSGAVIRDQIVFATEKVRYEGEPIAAVAADTLEQAQAAVGAIVVDLEEMTPVATMQEALAPDAPIIHEDLEQYEVSMFAAQSKLGRHANVAVESIAESDEVAEAFERAHLVVEDEFETGRQYQAPLEVRNAIGIYENGRYIVHTGSQWPFNVRDQLAEFLNVRPTDVRVIAHTVGGGFGAKLEAQLEHYAVLLSKAATGRPVRIVNTREEDLLTSPSRENTRTKIRSAIDIDGNIIGREYIAMSDCGAYCTETGAMVGLAAVMSAAPYRVGPTRVESRAIYTNTAPTGAMRGVCGTHICMANECHMDHIADELGVDRRAYRLQNLKQDGDKLRNGQAVTDIHILHDMFDELEKKAPWAKANANKGKYRGVGMAPAIWATNPLPATITVSLSEDGRAIVMSGANDNGTGATATGITQIVANVLGLGPTDVIMPPPDTDRTAYDGGSQGSRTTVVAGNAAKIAAEKLREKILEIAAGLLETEAGALHLESGAAVLTADPDKRLPLTQVALAAMYTGAGLSGTGTFMMPMAEYNPESATGLVFATIPIPMTYHLHMAEVEVDPVTGRVEVLRYIVIQDVGKAINPAAILGQIQGGLAQGLGLTLWESLRIDDGRYKERTLEAYRLPLAVDMPRAEAIILEYPTEIGPYGAKGVAEPTIVPVPATIANAISNAVRVRMNKLPITPEDVLEALDR